MSILDDLKTQQETLAQAADSMLADAKTRIAESRQNAVALAGELDQLAAAATAHSTRLKEMIAKLAGVDLG